jgi:hypothetical protein
MANKTRMSTNDPEACRGKRTYDHQEATYLAKKLRRNSEGRVDAFWCPACHGWHVGFVLRTTKKRPSPESLDISGETEYD